MRKTRYSEEQIIGIFREHEAGTSDLSRRHGIGQQIIYCWKRRYGGLEPSELCRLKKLVADQAFDDQRGGVPACGSKELLGKQC